MIKHNFQQTIVGDSFGQNLQPSLLSRCCYAAPSRVRGLLSSGWDLQGSSDAALPRRDELSAHLRVSSVFTVVERGAEDSPFQLVFSAGVHELWVMW